MSNKKVVLSAIQPTGDMHFGNYFGAVKNWVDLQADYDCVYGVVDYHAMTMPFVPSKLRQNTWELIFNLMATGVKAENLLFNPWFRNILNFAGSSTASPLMVCCSV